MRLELTGRHITITAAAIRRWSNSGWPTLPAAQRQRRLGAGRPDARKRPRPRRGRPARPRRALPARRGQPGRDVERRSAPPPTSDRPPGLKSRWSKGKRQGRKRRKPAVPSRAPTARRPRVRRTAAEPPARIVRARRYAVKPMSVDDAALEIGDGTTRSSCSATRRPTRSTSCSGARRQPGTDRARGVSGCRPMQPQLTRRRRLLRAGRCDRPAARAAERRTAALDRPITSPHIQKTGLALAGFHEYLRPGRVLVFGESEVRYLEGLDTTRADDARRGVRARHSLRADHRRRTPPPQLLAASERIACRCCARRRHADRHRQDRRPARRRARRARGHARRADGHPGPRRADHRRQRDRQERMRARSRRPRPSASSPTTPSKCAGAARRTSSAPARS